MGFRFGSSWGVAKKISKLPSWRGLQQNHARLQFYKGFPCKLGSLLGASNSLKIRYIQVETPKDPRPCTLACNCKIIWDSDFDKVGGFPRKFQTYPLGEASRKIMLNFNFTKDFPVNWKSNEFGSGKISKSPSYAGTQRELLSERTKQIIEAKSK